MKKDRTSLSHLLGLTGDSTLPTEVRAFRTMLLLAHRLRYLMDERLRADGLTTQQAALLTVVRALGTPMLGEAAAALGTSHQNVAQLAAALERKGMLRTQGDPDDRRRRRLVVTGASERYWRERDAGDEAALAGWFSSLSGDELQTLCSLADRVLAGLDSPAPPGGPPPEAGE